MEGVAFLAVVLLTGTLGSVIALKLKVSNVFFLVLTGMLLGILNVGSFPKEGMVVIAMISIVMIVFTSAIDFKINELVKYSHYIMKLSGLYFILIFVFLSTATYYLFGLKSAIVALLFSSLMFDNDASVGLTMLGRKKDRVSEILKIESIINTPITVIMSLTFLNLLLSGGQLSYSQLSENFWPFLTQFIYAAIIGLAFGFLVAAIIKKNDFGNLNYIIVMTSAIVAYIMAEYIEGNGILAVTIFGLVFGNYHLKKILEYEKTVSIFSDAVSIVVFVLLGTIIIIPAEDIFIIKGAFLFLVYVIIRFLAVNLSLKDFRLKEKIFMSINLPKGIDTAVIILVIISGAYSDIGDIKTIAGISMLFILYSVVLSTIATRFAPYFLSENVKKK